MTMQEKVLAFEQLPELIKNLAERVESLEKTVREKQQPQPLARGLMIIITATIHRTITMVTTMIFNHRIIFESKKFIYLQIGR